MKKRTPRTTTIDETIWKQFKLKCFEHDEKINDVLEYLMSRYINTNYYDDVL